MKDVLEKSAKLSYSPDVQEVDIWRTKFFAYVHESYRRVMRKEIFYALHCLDDLRFSMVTGWYMDAGFQPNTFGDWAKIEGSRSKLQEWQLHLLEQWHSSPEPDEIFKVIKNIIPEFLRVHKSLCCKLEMDENPKLVEEILNMAL